MTNPVEIHRQTLIDQLIKAQQEAQHHEKLRDDAIKLIQYLKIEIERLGVSQENVATPVVTAVASTSTSVFPVNFDVLLPSPAMTNGIEEDEIEAQGKERFIYPLIRPEFRNSKYSQICKYLMDRHCTYTHPLVSLNQMVQWVSIPDKLYDKDEEAKLRQGISATMARLRKDGIVLNPIRGRYTLPKFEEYALQELKKEENQTPAVILSHDNTSVNGTSPSPTLFS